MKKITGRKAALGSLYLTFNNILLKGVGLATMVLLTYSLGVKEYGRYLFLLTIPSFLSAFLSVFPTDMATADVARYLGRQMLEEAGDYLKEFAIIELCLGAVLSSIAFLFYLVPNVSILENKQLLPLLGGLVFLAAARNIANVILASKGKFATLAVWRSSEGVLRLASIGLMVYTLRLGVKGALLADVTSQALCLLAMALIASKAIKDLRVQSSTRKLLVFNAVRAHGKWAIFQKIGTNFSANYRIWIIRLLVGEEGVALFGLAKRIFSFAKTILPLRSVLGPTFAQNFLNKEKMKLYFTRAIKYKFLTGVLVFMVGFMLSAPAIRALFPKYFPSVVPVFRLFLALALVKWLNEVQVPLFNAFQQQKKAFLGFAIGGCVTIVLLPVLVTTLGVMGAVIEVIITSAIGGAVGYALLLRVEPFLKIYPKELVTFDKEDRAFLRNMLHIRKVG